MAESKVTKFRPDDSAKNHFGQLPEDLLQRIFATLSFEEKREVLPLVCQAWRKALGKPSRVWADINLNVATEAWKDLDDAEVDKGQIAAWFALRGHGVKNFVLHLSLSRGPLKPEDWVTIAIPYMRSLESLSIPFYAPAELAPLFPLLSSLQYLQIGTPEDESWLAEKLPSFRHLTNLQSLDLDWLCGSQFPTELCLLTQISSLSLRGCTAVTPEVASLTNLTSLNLMQYMDCKFPEVLTSLFHLTELELEWEEGFSEDEHCITLPSGLTNLSNLKQLTLENVAKLDNIQVLSTLSTLRSLDLKFCNLNELPESVSTLVDLEELLLFGNWITRVPDWITRLTKLTSLDLGGNGDRDYCGIHVKHGITQLTQLTKLCLSDEDNNGPIVIEYSDQEKLRLKGNFAEERFTTWNIMECVTDETLTLLPKAQPLMKFLELRLVPV